MDWAAATQMKLTATAVPIEKSLCTFSSHSLLRGFEGERSFLDQGHRRSVEATLTQIAYEFFS
jgi:hypothetical protein